MALNIKKTANDFFTDATNFTNNGNTYLQTYPHFVNYFNNLNRITFHEMTIGINFTYGWMPTIFDYRSNNFDDAIEILNRVKNGIVPNDNELNILKGLFNNSLVGSSKLMHFINPEIIPIWDSRVYTYLTGLTAYSYRVENINYFRDYLEFCNSLISDERFFQSRGIVQANVGYTMSNMRIADLVMYSN